MKGFVGRGRELRYLERELDAARRGTGRLVTVRGRKQVGKSWLVSEFLDRYSGPRLYFDAHGHTETRELDRFRAALAGSSLPSAQLGQGEGTFGDWEAALLSAAADASIHQPSIIVLDEFPDLCERRGGSGVTFSPQEGAVRAAWRRLEQLPVVLVLIGSDLAMMERLVVYGGPLYQRPTCELVVPPLSPLEVSRLGDRSAAAALDAYLVTGGFPKIARLWPGGDLASFLSEALADPRSDLVRSGSMVLDTEFPSNANARSVLSVIGTGERTHSKISARTGVKTTNLTGPYGPLTLLEHKGLIAKAQPLSTATTTLRQYRIVDPYLRFWLQFIEPNLGEIERGLGPSIVPRIVGAFPEYRGHAIEPIVRQAIERLAIAGDTTFDGARAVGSYWDRDGRVQVDLIGADRVDPPAGRIAFTGTIKWRERQRVIGQDIAALADASAAIRGVGAATRMVAVSRSGFDRRIAAPVRKVSPDEILQAFPAD